jgi:hypothetical protein
MLKPSKEQGGSAHLRPMIRPAAIFEAGIANNYPGLYGLIERNGFPQPVQLGDKSIAFFADEVRNWVESRKRSSSSPAPETAPPVAIAEPRTPRAMAVAPAPPPDRRIGPATSAPGRVASSYVTRSGR